MQRTSHFGRWLFLALAGAALLGLLIWALALWRTSSLPYIKKTLPIWSTRKLYWVDNSRALFAGIEANIGGPENTTARTLPPIAIYLWDTDRDALTRYVELGVNGDIVCFGDAVLRYYVQDPRDIRPETAFVYQQVIGGTATLEGGGNVPYDKTRGRWITSQFGCNATWEADLVRPQHFGQENTTLLLRPTHGYLWAPALPHDAQYKNVMSSPIELFQPGATPGIRLPVLTKELLTTIVGFSEYRNQYIIAAGVHRDERNPTISGYALDRKRPVYFVSPSGSVETVWFPNYDWITGGMGFVPTVSGYLVVSNFGRRTGPAGIGAWISNVDREVKIVDEYVDAFAVSPDGCKAALATGTLPERGRSVHSVSVFDFCSKKASANP